MSIESCALDFDGFQVNKLLFEKNESYTNDNNKIKLQPIFKREISKSQSNQYLINLSVELKNDDNQLPFALIVDISGFFRLDCEEDSEMLLKQNAVAILFPYLRSLVTTLTANAGVQPIILPAINIAKMIEKSEQQE